MWALFFISLNDVDINVTISLKMFIAGASDTLDLWLWDCDMFGYVLLESKLSVHYINVLKTTRE